MAKLHGGIVDGTGRETWKGKCFYVNFVEEQLREHLEGSLIQWA